MGRANSPGPMAAPIQASVCSCVLVMAGYSTLLEKGQWDSGRQHGVGIAVTAKGQSPTLPHVDTGALTDGRSLAEIAMGAWQLRLLARGFSIKVPVEPFEAMTCRSHLR